MLAIAWMLVHILQPLTTISGIELPEIQTEVREQQLEKVDEEQSVILEVEGSPEEHAKHIERYYPNIEIVAVYSTLLQGLALKGEPSKVEQIRELEFVQGTYPVQTYITLDSPSSPKRATSLDTIKKLVDHPKASFPEKLNSTSFTGKGIKIGVIDTGLDVTHPDLQKNYQGGFDLVDLDNDPMETTIEEGMPTLHGTHVAGIIAADGQIKGVAPDSKLYAYRALGPGGVGSSIHVIAALEEAIHAEMDIVNLSLGNTINGPDYPTSKAVNQAAEQGMAVVVANGNDGPDNWTVGAPATAASALSVGAYEQSGKTPVLYNPVHHKHLSLTSLPNTPPWVLEKDYLITDKVKHAQGKIVMLDQQKDDFAAIVEEAQQKGAKGMLVHATIPSDQQWMADLEKVEIDVPIAIISEADGKWITQHRAQATTYYQTKYQKTNEKVAAFSSRGPVTVNWMMKPDLIAPGVKIVSTVPGGYKMLNGTSMAAPHVAGALAVLKEAHPDWTNQQLIGGLKTTAERVTDMSPIDQGSGLIDLKAALKTDLLIYNPLLSFGRINDFINERTVTITIENVSETPQSFHFNIPKKIAGQTWDLPHPFELAPQEKKSLPITLKLNSKQMDEGINEGYLELEGANRVYQLPYAAIGKTEEFPRVMGFQFSMDSATEDCYHYSLYAAEAMKKITVRLYDPDTLVDQGRLLELENTKAGMHEGELEKQEVTQRGYYYGLIVTENEQGEIRTHETEVFIR